MQSQRLFHTAGLLVATLLCWLYGLHLYRSANSSLTSKSAHNSQHSDLAAAAHAPKVLDDSSDNILTFIHASDVHISKFVPHGGYIHFLHFLKTAVPLIAPRLVTITGDLTDGKDEQRLTSMQQIEEWQAYQKTLKEFGVREKFSSTFYRDQRGNHDCFDVFSFDDHGNYYKNYSAVGTNGYQLDINESFGRYSFIATDGCPKYGFARPLNFFGYLDARDMQQLEQRMALAAGANHTFLLNHYPVSTMLYGKYSKSFGELAKGVSVFLCGHLHQLVGGIGAQLQAYKAQDGYWELEIGDMKDHALYRVYAIDNDLVSFVDVTLPLPEIPMHNPEKLGMAVPKQIAHPPVILATNPKDARYLLPRHEPLERIRTSKFIRILVWADQPVQSVSISIDGKLHDAPVTYKGKETAPDPNKSDEKVKVPLWVSPWDPNTYDDGQIHEMVIVATDKAGKTTTQRIPFHLGTDLIPLHNDARGGWIMRQDFPAIFRISNTVTYFLMTVLLVILPRLFVLSLASPSTWVAQRSLEHHKDEARLKHLWAVLVRGDVLNPVSVIKLALTLVGSWSKFLVATQFTAQVYFTTIPWLYWPAYAFCMMLAIAPLFSGRLIPSAGAGGVGSVYVYGIYIAGDWAPLLDSYTYALTSVITLVVLLVYIPVAATPVSVFYSPRVAGSRPWYRSFVVRVLVAVFVVVYLGLPTMMTVYTYGWTSIVFGFGRAWIVGAGMAALYLLDWHFYQISAAKTYGPVPTNADNEGRNSGDTE